MSMEGRWERASGIAWYRLHRLIDQHVESAVNDSIEMKTKAN